jgi:hypothetical protein
MSIPLDRLYHYIESVAKEMHDDALIYRFYPHGFKNIENLRSLKQESFFDLACSPGVYCNDQEPLNFDFYRQESDRERDLMTKHNLTFDLNFRFPFNIFDQCVLLHSEQGGSNLANYINNSNYVSAYYWSHALIARDWYRYTEHVKFNKKSNYKFLIYNRAWGGSREYRLKFADLLIDFDLIKHCKTACNFIDPDLEVHYDNYKFQNEFWRPANNIEDYFAPNNTSSCSSADFDIDDYESTDIEVVLETLFDDDRIHLTEKILRPIACGQPFILASTSNSLKYLQHYGFKTFDTVWDESYNLEIDPEIRLIKVVKLIKEISTWSPDMYQTKLNQARNIALHNQKHFFSHSFMQQITNELKNNLENALNQVINNNTCNNFLHRCRAWLSMPDMKHRFENKYTSSQLNRVIAKAVEINNKICLDQNTSTNQ